MLRILTGINIRKLKKWDPAAASKKLIPGIILKYNVESHSGIRWENQYAENIGYYGLEQYYY